MSSLPALLVTALCGCFAWLVTKQFVRTHKPSHFWWSISLITSSIASLAYCCTEWTHPHSVIFFRLYYLFGAMLMPALMGLGSLGLVLQRMSLRICSILVSLCGFIGILLLCQAAVSTPSLEALDGGAGTGVIVSGWWLAPLIALNCFGALAVALVAVWSAVKAFRKQSPARFFYGNVWLCLGILIISAAGSAARLGWPHLFWWVMLAGWIVTFVGYRWLTPRVPVRSGLSATSA